MNFQKFLIMKILKDIHKDKTTVQDAKWYGAEPIWVTAEKNNLISYLFWVDLKLL